MDPRRLLIMACAGASLSGCALFRDGSILPPSVESAVDVGAAPTPGTATTPDAAVAGLAAIPTDPAGAGETAPGSGIPPPSDGDAVVGALQLFVWTPGRVYPVRTAPLRVTTLTLGPGETLVSKAAGDTVRWQIGETSSGDGPNRRAHVLIKPLQRGLDTNLVLTTSRRVYLLELSSGGVDHFNVAVAWDAGALEAERSPAFEGGEAVRLPDPVATPDGPLDARYRIEPVGRRARWTPVSVVNDGVRTFITFPPDLQIDEAPALFIIAPDGEAQMVNYRQAGGLFIVDRVFDRAELRLGDRRPQVVRLRRLAGAVR
ncbi:MAG: TrbG/VirB9 family P-type conjugative transfer protein [Brevundimonas sp.]